jgi:hypothetical protein
VYYYSDGNTIFAGPTWDFDIAFAEEAPTGFLQPVTDNTLYRGLLQYPEFKEALAKRFDEVYAELVPTLKAELEYLKTNSTFQAAVAKHEELYHRNSRLDVREEWFAQSPTINNIDSIEGHLEYIKGWLLDGVEIDGTQYEGRLEWLKNHITEL